MPFIRRFAIRSVFIIILSFFVFDILNAFGDTIIDNGDPETSFTGTWKVSGGVDPYAEDSLWSRDGSTYIWIFTPTTTGFHEVFMWWTYMPSRSANIPVIIKHAFGTANVTINQQGQAGQWNSLGQYPFESGQNYNITITAQPGPSSTNADAVRFAYVPGNVTPAATIDSIDPNPTTTDNLISFVGHGDDIDGTISGYSWDSNIDGHLSDDASFTATLSLGSHTVSFTVLDNEDLASEPVTHTVNVRTFETDVIIDNAALETSSTGIWQTSGAVDPYDENSLWSREGATYTWTFIPITPGLYEVSMWWTFWSSRSTNVPILINHAGGSLTVSVDQQENSSQWNPLGQFIFETGISYDITMTAQAYPSSTSADAVKFVFLSENSPPEAFIDMINPNPALVGNEIVFSGFGTDLNGSIVDYSWRSSIDGQLSNLADFNTSDLPAGLSEGVHTIYFKVQDDEGIWSPEKNAILVYRSCSSPIKIMPLGNSITYDTYGDPRPNGLRTGYRQPLWSSLEEGYNMDFVGSLVAGDEATPLFDPDNDGHPGWRDDEIANGRSSDPSAGKLADWLIDYDPDIVLLHIGTNWLDPSPSDVENILNIIDAYTEEIIVILARIINRSDYSQTTTDFNDNIQRMAEARITIGDKIIIVDMEDGAGIDYRLETNGGDMADNLHPNENGYAKMAVIWFDALENILPPCAEFAPFIFTHPDSTGEVGQSYTYQVGAIGYPQPTFSLLANPAGMSIDSITGLILWTPNSGQEGGHNVTVQAQSAEGMYTQTYTVEAKEFYSISATASGGNGTIVCNPTEVFTENSSTCTITPNAGYALLQLSDNGADVTDMASGYTYVVSDINEGHVIDATFAVGTIIDNLDPQTSSTGTWIVSGGADPYDIDSLWGRDGSTFNWIFTPTVSGSYDISMWWTFWSSRSTDISVSIEHSGGTASVTINQQENDSQWNQLGQYSFNAGISYSVMIEAQSGPSSTSADAVKFIAVSP